MTAEPRAARPATYRSVGVTVAIAAATLLAFGLVSAGSEWASRGFGVGGDAAPPVYGRYAPRIGAWALLPLTVLAAGVAVARRAIDLARSRPVVFLGAAVVFMLGFGLAAGVMEGRPSAIVSPIAREGPPDYQVDVVVPRTVGVRAFVESHPEVVASLRSVHSVSHPPGPIVVLRWLEMAFPGSLYARAAVIALLGAFVLIPTWVVGRRVAGVEGGAIAVMLLAVAPAPVLFGWTSLDAVFATVLVAGFALFAAGIHDERARTWPVLLAGFVLGLATFLTYATVFVAVAAGLYALMRLRPGAAGVALARATAGGIAALVLLRVAIGFDLFASYGGSYEALLAYDNPRPYWYWVVGNPMVWLTFAGPAIAGLEIRRLAADRDRVILATLIPLAVFYVLPYGVTHLLPGEVERTLMFAYPAAVVGVGAWLAANGRSRVLPGLVAVTGATTLTLEAVYDFFW